MKVSDKKSGTVYEAVQWFRNGDVPDDYSNTRIVIKEGSLFTETPEQARLLGHSGQIVSRYFSATKSETECSCGQLFENHGLVANSFFDVTGQENRLVCPGDWMLKGPSSPWFRVAQNDFNDLYEVVNEN